MRKFLIVLLLLLIPFTAQAVTTYNCTALTGGAARSLDYISVDDLSDGDRAFVITSGGTYCFKFNATSVTAETTTSHPYYVRPDDFSSAGVWVEHSWIPTLPGVLVRPRFSWKDADEITISSGVYSHKGTTEQILLWNATLTFQFGSAGSNASSTDLAAGDWFYVYLDDSAIVTSGSPVITATQIVDSTTEPSYSTTKHGWYNGSDLCIFAALTEAGAANLREFSHGGDLVVYADEIQDLTDTDIDTTWTDVTLTLPSFVRKAQVLFGTDYSDGAASLSYRTDGQAGTTGHYVMYSNVDSAAGRDTCNVIASTSQKIEIKHSASNANTARVYTQGWYFPYGM